MTFRAWVAKYRLRLRLWIYRKRITSAQQQLARRRNAR